MPGPKEVVTARQRTTGQPRAVECDENGNLHVMPGAGDGVLPVRAESVACSTADVHAPAANTAAVVTYGAVVGHYNAISGVLCSYSGGVPTGGRLTITDAGATIFDTDIVEEGPAPFAFPFPKRSAQPNTVLIVTLAAGGAGITGKVNVLNHWTEAA